MVDKSQVQTLEYFMNFDWSTSPPPYFWYEKQSIVTHFFNALSLGIPETERFLVRTIKAFEHEVKEPRLTEELQRFILEENQHSLQHTRFNLNLKGQRYPVSFSQKFFRFGYKVISKLFTKKFQLAISVGLEHMTAVIAEYGFNNEIMKPNVCATYDLFRWHAYEELGHKSITFDLYQRLGAGYIRRVLAMLYVTLIFIFGVATIQTLFIFVDLYRRRGVKMHHISYAFKFFWGKKGLFPCCFRNYFRIYRINFIP